MLRWLLRRTTEAFEQKWNYDAGYLKEIISISPKAAWMFARATSLGNYRRDVPLAAQFAAGLTAVRLEDCGPCTQLGATMAERQGVPPAVVRAIVTEDVSAMPEEVELAWRFARATLAHDPAADELRREIVKRWGPRALVTLAFAITTARMYPTVKYAMGHGQVCSRVVVGGTPVAVDRTTTQGPWAAAPRPTAVSRA